MVTKIYGRVVESEGATNSYSVFITFYELSYFHIVLVKMYLLFPLNDLDHVYNQELNKSQ